MDIGSGTGYPSAALSNFAPHSFVIDGVECASMEGFLQSLKFQDPEMQKLNYHILNISNGILFAVGVLIVIGIGYLQGDKEDGFSLRVIIKETLDDIASHQTTKTTDFTVHQDKWTYSENAHQHQNHNGTYNYTETTKIVDEGANDAK